MTRLEEIFKEILYNYSNEQLQVEDCAKKCQEVAIAFAKRLMSTEVVFKRTGRVESGYECSVEYPHNVPPEYSLMYGELVRNGDKLFDKFIEENYESY